MKWSIRLRGQSAFLTIGRLGGFSGRKDQGVGRTSSFFAPRTDVARVLSSGTRRKALVWDRNTEDIQTVEG